MFRINTSVNYAQRPVFDIRHLKLKTQPGSRQNEFVGWFGFFGFFRDRRGKIVFLYDELPLTIQLGVLLFSEFVEFSIQIVVLAHTVQLENFFVGHRDENRFFPYLLGAVVYSGNLMRAGLYFRYLF